MPTEPGDAADRVRRAGEALTQAKADARARGDLPAGFRQTIDAYKRKLAAEGPEIATID